MSAIRFIFPTLSLICCGAFVSCSAVPQTETHLDAVANFRDIGGYKTADGHVIRHGLLYRSAQLSNMTPADRVKLAGLGIRYEIDLRSQQERRSQPTRWGSKTPDVLTPFHYAEDGQVSVSAAPASSISISTAALKVTSPTATVAQVNEVLSKGYIDITLNRAAEMGVALHDLANGNSPALLHCTGGKDRTGVLVAVLMTLLGVPHDPVYAEYLKSNDQLTVWYEQRKAKAQADKPPYDVPFELFKAQSGVDSTWLDTAFKAINKQYGSFDEYVADGLKLSLRDVERLRTRFLD